MNFFEANLRWMLAMCTTEHKSLKLPDCMPETLGSASRVHKEKRWKFKLETPTCKFSFCREKSHSVVPYYYGDYSVDPRLIHLFFVCYYKMMILSLV